MSDTPIYDQLRDELLTVDVPAGDNNAAPPQSLAPRQSSDPNPASVPRSTP